METECTIKYIDNKSTGYFSKLVTDYLDNKAELHQLYKYQADDEGLKAALEERFKFPIDRKTLVEVLTNQYKDLEQSEAVKNNIALLKDENTFTICTAHQPNLMGGYLYFIYKILHTVKLSQHLKAIYPKSNFVPVFYIGSEDNDFEELSVFRYEGKQYKWESKQTGAVGRMTTEDLSDVIEQLFEVLGPPNANTEKLKEIITNAYQSGKSIAQATQYLINALLGRYGVVALDADDRSFKINFKNILREELFDPKAFKLVQNNSAFLNENYKAQAFARPINLFYLKDNIRERIEQQDDVWKVLNTDISFNRNQLEDELEQHPERFSPNVILRGLYQESILPNVAFIGGGSEVAYWMQLKGAFEYYKIFYPTVILRQSALWISKEMNQLQRKLNFSEEELFIKKQALQTHYIHKHYNTSLIFNQKAAEATILFKSIIENVKDIDVTLENSTAAVAKKIQYQLEVLEKKVTRALKRKEATIIAQIDKLKSQLFPNDSLQERYDSFLAYYVRYGHLFFDKTLEGTVPYGNRFLIIEENT